MYNLVFKLSKSPRALGDIDFLPEALAAALIDLIGVEQTG